MIARCGFIPFSWALAALAGAMFCATVPAAAQSSGATPAATPAAPVMVGWAERARIFPGNLPMQAKLDTGANTSSLNVESYVITEHDGKKWARITAANRANAKRTYELEVIRFSKTKDHGGPLRVRPVVRLEICIAGIRKTAELNVSKRGKFIYKLLLGRRFLANTFTIDPSRKFTRPSNCT
jgi:hypothetical protein